MIQRLHPDDNAIVALTDLHAGQCVGSWTLLDDVPAKHKFTACALAAGDPVIMYGVTVGRVRCALPAGARLTTDNLAHAASECRGKRPGFEWRPPDVAEWWNRTFEGYVRPRGRAGTANYWLIVPLVFCENRNVTFLQEALAHALGHAAVSPYTAAAQRMAEAWRRGERGDNLRALAADNPPETASRLFPNVDGVKVLTHAMGCGGTREDSATLAALLAGYIDHPNVAGAVVLSLGCQHTQVPVLEAALAQRNPRFAKPLHIFEQQKSASERDLMLRSLEASFRGAAQANESRRQPVPLSQLAVGLKCGGSDGFSGLSANPAMGHAADLLAACGGLTALAEFPELCGVEQDLCDRCESTALADRFLSLMNDYARAAAACGSGFEMNPSPGNIRDGLITDAMKSAGAARKGGTAPVVDVLDYTEPLTRGGGVSLIRTPGSDVECTSALAGAGCTLITFSTGLGTPTGNPVCPVLKISTNTSLARRMADIIDMDCGPVLTGEKSISQSGAEMLELVLATASGRYVPHAVRLGQDDFLPWKRGVSL